MGFRLDDITTHFTRREEARHYIGDYGGARHSFRALVSFSFGLSDALRDLSMGDTWIIDLTHFLDKNGEIAPAGGPARRLAEHIVAIVSMASRPEIIPPPQYQVRCRRRPGRKTCSGLIEVDLDSDTEDIVWWCPICQDNGRIRNWKGTIWDLRNAKLVH